MKILIGCELSQVVCKAFRARGHEAFSCDILPCEGGHPEWHLQEDVLDVIKREKFDMIIGHPPCTYLSNAGIRWFNEERYGDKARLRKKLRLEAMDFVLKIANAKCDKIVIENPVGWLNSHWRKPDQIIQPWMFGENFNKPTCLWIKGLPKLIPTDIVDKGEMVSHITKKGKVKTDSKWYYEAFSMKPAERQKFRSKTFQGIADGLADQYTKFEGSGFTVDEWENNINSPTRTPTNF